MVHAAVVILEIISVGLEDGAVEIACIGHPAGGIVVGHPLVGEEHVHINLRQLAGRDNAPAPSASGEQKEQHKTCQGYMSDFQLHLSSAPN